MLKEIKTTKQPKLKSKKEIIDNFDLTNTQFNKICNYLKEITIYNKHTNIVGKSTLLHSWNRHVVDSMQICNFINNKNSSILDMGTGAGIPGIFLSINNYKNVSVIDSNYKKIKFIKYVCKKLDINVEIYHKRIELLFDVKFDYLVSRALCNLNKLFFYSHKFLKKRTVLVFLKGQSVKDEINTASKIWSFKHDIYQSISDKRGFVIVVKELIKINE